MPASEALEYREYHVNHARLAKTTSPLLFYLIYSAPLSLSLLDLDQFLGILFRLFSRPPSPSPITYQFPQYSLDLNMGESG